jgi:hypothetical protein
VNDIDNFETDLERMLGQTVDAKLGTRRQPPVFVPQPRAGRGARPWLIPLAAAACVVAVAVGTVGATRVLSEHRRVQPASPSPTVNSPAPTPSSSQRPSSSPSPAASSTVRASGRNVPAQPTTVTLAGATLRLPPTWVARDFQQYLGRSVDAQVWCLTPASLPAGTGRYDCPLMFSTIAAKAVYPVDVDTESGYSSDPHYCDVGNYLSSTVQSSDVDFGGRLSDHRRWVRNCHNGDSYRIEQYVVATGPGFVLFSEKADDAISATMAGIVAHATLPAQTSAVRYYDHGYVRSVTPVAGGIRISVDRVVPATGGSVNNNPATYDYLVPAAVLAKKTPPQVGGLVTVFTDGSQVTSFYAH